MDIHGLLPTGFCKIGINTGSIKVQPDVFLALSVLVKSCAVRAWERNTKIAAQAASGAANIMAMTSGLR